MFLKKYNLKNKTALVTGAGKGLGRACAIALSEGGSNLIIISRTKKDLSEVSKIIKKNNFLGYRSCCCIKNYIHINNCLLITDRRFKTYWRFVAFVYRL